MTFARSCIALLAGLALVGQTAALAADSGSKLLVTSGLTSIGGSAGAGLATWALIAGYETEHQVGAATSISNVGTGDVQLNQQAVNVGFSDRLELSFAHQSGDLGARANSPLLGSLLHLEQDVIGIKVRVLGQAIYDQDTWRPQISVGVQFKKAENSPLPLLLGARDTSDVEFYVAATKILLPERLLLNATLRSTRANQLGLLGFGGPFDNSRDLQIETSVGYLLDRRTLVGVEYMSKKNRLPSSNEQDWFDAFIAYFPRKSVSVVAGYADLGALGMLGDQHGLYSSIQVGF